MRERENKLGRVLTLLAAGLLLVSQVSAQTPSSPSTNPFSGLADLFKPRGPQDGTNLTPQGDSKQAPPTLLPPGFSGKFEFKSMTARELFAVQGMASTMAQVQRIAADAKANKGGALTDAMGALTMDTGSLLRLSMRMTASYLSFTALEALLTTMADDASLMDKVTVDIPQLGALGPPQLQDELMGAARFLVAMKAANQMVATSEKSLDAAKTRYRTILKDRETKAVSLGKANMLVNGVFNLGNVESSAKALSVPDMAYLKGFYGKPLDVTLKDPLARELINRELQAQEPGEYVAILEGEKEVAQHYSAYSRTAVGTLSMLGFGSMFMSKVMDLANQSDLHKLMLLPLAKDGAVEMVGMVKGLVAALARNDDLIEGTFSITTVDGKTTTGIGASRLLKSLTKEQLAVFRKSLIGGGTSSYIAVLDRQMPTSAADILDRVVEREAKGVFAKSALSMENPDMFSFKSTFVPPVGAQGKRVEQKIKQRLYEEDLEIVQDDDSKPFSEVQKIVRADVTKMSNQDLRRIMLSHKGAESLPVGDVLIRMEQPGLQGLADRQEMTMAAIAQAQQDIKRKSDEDATEARSRASSTRGKDATKPVPAQKKVQKKT